MQKILCLIIGILLCAGCTKNQRARTFGGSVTNNIPCGKKLVNITWKENSLWILTREMQENEEPTSYQFNEDSNLGIAEGSITITECKK